MSGKRSRNKGKVYERRVSKLLTDAGYPAERGVQFHGGSESPDVRMKCDLPIHPECKNQESLNIWKALTQVESDAGVGKAGVVFFTRNHADDYVAMRFEDWVWLLDWVLDNPKGVKGC